MYIVIRLRKYLEVWRAHKKLQKVVLHYTASNSSNLQSSSLSPPNIRRYILHSVLYTYPKVLTRRIRITIKSFFYC